MISLNNDKSSNFDAMGDNVFSDGESNNESMSETFGDYLRRHREASGKTLDSVSRTTRIAKRFLQAFEDNDTNNLPEEAFCRGFLRSYAVEIGMDPDECLSRYEKFRKSLLPASSRENRRTPPPGVYTSATPSTASAPAQGALPKFEAPQNESVVSSSSSEARSTGSSQSRSTNGIMVAGVVIAVLVTVTLWFIRARESTPSVSESESTSQTETSASTSESSNLTPSQLNSEIASGTNGQDSQSNEAEGPSFPPTASILSAQSKLKSSGKEPASQTGQSAPNAMATPVKPSTLQIKAQKAAKVSIRLDENAIQELTFQPGETQTLFVFREVEIRSGERGALQYQYNGKPLEVSGPVIKLFNRNLFPNSKR